MGKYFLLFVILAVIAGGIWFYRLGGPAQLELADRLWPGQSEPGSIKVASDIGYGSIDPDADAARQSYDVYWPQGADDPNGCTTHKIPSLIFFHGGSWRNGDRKSYAFVGRAFAARGYYTFVVDYRKLPKHRFPDFIADAARAITTIHKSLDRYPCADPQKLFVMGHSAGAHIAMLAALDPKWLAANNSDASIISGVIGLAGPYDFYPFTSDAAREAMGHWPEPLETQPIHYARSDAPPMLLLTGDADTTVKPRNSTALAKAAQAIGGRALMKEYAGLDHADIVMAIARPFRTKAPVINDVADFIASTETSRTVREP